MSDLEICVRIAKIEDVFRKIVDEVDRQSERCSRQLQTGAISYFKAQSFEDIYNPIINDALCFELMVKYAIKVAPRIGNTTATWTGGDIEASGDKHTNKAICLAIIEAFKS